MEHKGRTMVLKERKKLIKRCDDLFSKQVRTRGECEKCGQTVRLSCAHIISRTYMATRWDQDNALCLCSGCHLFWHKEPILASRWLEQKWPGRFDKLNLKRQAITKVDLQNVFLMLRHETGAGKEG